MGRLVGLLDSMSTPAMIIDNDFSVQYMNELGAKVGAKTQAQLVGTKCFDPFKTSDCKTDRCAWSQAMRNGQQDATSETDAHPGKLDLDITYRATPLHTEDGKIIGAFEVVSDQAARSSNLPGLLGKLPGVNLWKRKNSSNVLKKSPKGILLWSSKPSPLLPIPSR